MYAHACSLFSKSRNYLLAVFVRACLFTVSCLEKCIVWSYMTLFYYVFSFFYKNFQFCMHMLVLYSVKAEIAFLRYDCSWSHVWRNVQCNAIHRLLLCFFFVFLFFICMHTPVQCFHWKMFQCFCSILSKEISNFAICLFLCSIVPKEVK